MYNNGGTVKIGNCSFVNNVAAGTNGAASVASAGPGGDAAGGAIYNAGDLWITNSTFTENRSSGGAGGDGLPGGNGGGGQAGALYNSGVLTVCDSSFSGNLAVGGKGGIARDSMYATAGAGGHADGGVICNEGTSTLLRCSFSSNAARGGEAGSTENVPPREGSAMSAGDGRGGALRNTATLGLTNCWFSLNEAVGGSPGSAYYGRTGAHGSGGALHNTGELAGTGCVFALNRAIAGKGGGYKHILDGAATGGAIYNAGDLWLADGVVSSNRVSYGQAAGGGLYNANGSADLKGTTLAFNSAESGTAGDWYYGGGGFDSWGGAVFNSSSASFEGCSFLNNSVMSGPATYADGGSGGSVGNSGNGFGGGIASTGDLVVDRCGFLSNSVSGAAGVFGRAYGIPLTSRGGGTADGAIAALEGTAIILNTTIYRSSALGGQGSSVPADATYGDGGPGGWALGAGIFLTNAVAGITNCTSAGNLAIPGPGGTGSESGLSGAGAGGGICVGNGATLGIQNTIVSLNTAGDVAGTFSGTGNLVAIDARLGNLATDANGSIFLPLLPDSPAIDGALPVAGLDLDQRGVLRPFGAAPDIGAYEWNGTTVFWIALSTPREQQDIDLLKGAGPPNQQFRIQVSADLAHWTDTATNSTGSSGLFRCSVPVDLSEPMQFYRVVSP